MDATLPYPAGRAERDRWILARRGPRPVHDVWQAQGSFVESECAEDRGLVSMLTVLLTSRECPWRCLMCDLWKFTVETGIPSGAIPAQIRQVLADRSATGDASARRQLKLYNGGSFFDPRAVPPADDDAIADLTTGFERVIVECHPTLVGGRCLRFQHRLRRHGVALEVAMGLETAHPEVLEKLNKRMTLARFRGAAQRLRQAGIASRAFVLLKPPFLNDDLEALHWAMRSIEFAFGCGVGTVVLIPTRDGNGAMETLAHQGHYAPPRAGLLETALARGLADGRGRVFADLWDFERLATCPACRVARRDRLHQMNLTQKSLPPVTCAVCPD